MRKTAYTMFEILLVIAITVSLFAISLPIYNSSRYASDLDNAHRIATSSIRTAQLHAMSGLNDRNWGVYINSNQIVMYSGNSYTTRITQDDLIYTLPPEVLVSGILEANFTKIYGSTANTGLISFSKGGNTKQIEINRYGIEDY